MTQLILVLSIVGSTVWIFMDASQHGVGWRHLAAFLIPMMLFLVWFVVDLVVDIALRRRTGSVDKMQHKEGK